MKKYLKSICAFLIFVILIAVLYVSLDQDNDNNLIPEETLDQTTESGIRFSTPPGFYDKTLKVIIDSNEECVVYYTFDGNVPGETLAVSECNKYEKDGIELISVGNKTSVYSITARALYDDGRWGECIYNTYAVGGNVSERFTNLTVFITCDPDKLFGYENGILVAGKLRDDYIANNPGAEVIAISPAGYNLRGWESEREINVQMYTAEGQQIVNQTAGVRPFGAYSRASILKSLKLYARTDYDPINNKFSYPFFGEHYALDGSGRLITEYKRILLRSSGSDLNNKNGSHMRDELHQTLAARAGFPGAQMIEPVSVFINGEYYGSMWAHDVISDKWFEQHYGAYLGTMAVASGPEREKPDKRYEIDSIEEDQFFYDEWNELYDTYGDADMTDDEVYEEFCSKVDVDNYLFYYAINTYINNNDWPNNNHKAYRYYAAEGEEYREGTVFDGRWRFLVHDMDWLWGAEKNILNNNLLCESTRSKIFRALMEREECVEIFVDYCMEIRNGAFSPENYIAAIDEMHSERYDEMVYYKNESKYANGSLQSVEDAVEFNREFARQRPDTLVSDLKQAFGFSGKTYTVNVKQPEYCYVSAGNWKIEEEFLGTYIIEHGETYGCRPIVGYEFSHWIVNGEKIDTPELYVDEYYRVCGNVEIEAVVVPKREMALSVYEYSSEGGEDYLVLYNPSATETISTYGYSLSDTYDKLGKYVIPPRQIAPGEMITVYCDNYTGTEKYHQMAVPFNLKEGEKLYLSDSGNVVEEITLMPLHDGCSAVRSLNDNKFYEKIITK